MHSSQPVAGQNTVIALCAAEVQRSTPHTHLLLGASRHARQRGYRARWERKRAEYQECGIGPHGDGGGPEGSLIETRDEKGGSLDTGAVLRRRSAATAGCRAPSASPRSAPDRAATAPGFRRARPCGLDPGPCGPFPEHRPARPVDADPAAQVMVAGNRGPRNQQQPRHHRKCG